MDIKQRINKFNTENRPFYIVDHENGEYSLCLALSFMPKEYVDFGQEAFNRYAMEAGEPVLVDGRWFRHGNGHEWQIVFEKAFEGDPHSGGITYDCEAGGFFCYAKNLSLIEDFGTRFRAICMDGERFTELVCIALKEDAERESRMERIRDTVRGFLTENPQCNADIMTPDGLVRLTAGQGKQLLDGSLKTVAAGDLKIDAEGLLCQKITDMQQDLFRTEHFQIKTRAPEQVITQSLAM
ncbi:MAG: immunity 51 family protein [Lachnospiraceae bacterium]|nr:immunity 51 family protein [Lachnospiraceae bacterium]